MAEVSRSRSESQQPQVTFDDRLWPVLLALLLVGSVGAVLIARVADFDEPRWWANGWTYEASLGLATLFLMIVVSLVDRARRVVQLAALLSLLVHIGLFLGLNQYRLEALDREDERRMAESAQEREFRAPDYYVRAPENTSEDFERPLETELPQTRPEEIDRQPTARDEPALAGKPAPVAGESIELEPQIVPLQRLQEAAARQAWEAAALSRVDPSRPEIVQPQRLELPEAAASTELTGPQPEQREPAVSAVVPELALQAPSVEHAAPSNVAEPPRLDVAALARPRAESVAATPQVPSLSGTQAMRRVEVPQLRAPLVADLPRAQSGSDEPWDDPAPQVPVPARSGLGLADAREAGQLAAPAERPVAVPATSPGIAALAPRRAERGDAPPIADHAASLSDLLSKSAAEVRPDALDESRFAKELPELAATGGAGELDSSMEPAAPARGALSPARQAAAAPLPVRVTAPAASGGLGERTPGDLGIPSRRASDESRLADASIGRILAPKAGGPLALDGRSRSPTEAFAHRADVRQQAEQPSQGLAARTEAAIELGLEYLARQQRPDGSWNLHEAGEATPDGASVAARPTFRAETAATGLALLSFLGAGYDHYGGPYAALVQRALNYLVGQQHTNGDLYRMEDVQANLSARLYSHGIAAIALCEAYGMTGDASLREPAQRAVDFIVAAQDPRRGAWRYTPGDGSDTSVSGWQLMALKSGELAGLQVPPRTYDRVRGWLDGAQVVGSRYVYNPQAPDTPQQRHGRQPTAVMTAVGLLMRLYTGLDRSDPHLVEGAEYLLTQLPEDGARAAAPRDTYYWYYATQVMFHMRGKYWNAWNARLHPLLVESQLDAGPLAGSWDPRRPFPDRWGPHAGRLYVTTLNLLSLEVYYRHLPLYDSAAQ